MADRKPLPKTLTGLLARDEALELDSICSQIIDRARKRESFIQDDVVGLEDAYRAKVAERLKQICAAVWFIASQLDPDEAAETMPREFDPNDSGL